MSIFTVLMADDDGDYSLWIETLRKSAPGMTFREEPTYKETTTSFLDSGPSDTDGFVRVLTAQSAQEARNILLRVGAEIHAVFVDMTFTGTFTLLNKLDDDELERGLCALESGSLNLDGFRLAHLAREMNPRAYIAIITGQTPGEMMERPHLAAWCGDIDTWISKRDLDAALYFSFKLSLKIGAPARFRLSEYDIVGESSSLKAQLDRIPLYSAPGVRLPVLITGETGTGKEGAAKAIHRRSERADQPFVAVNCTALVETLAESELFGHEKGAFTGANATRRGAFEIATGGTLFLDEIGDMPLTVQSKLLRTLEVRNIQRVGSMETIDVDVRIVAATNADLDQRVKDGQFRRDLFHRINVLPLVLPPLRERGKDVHLLAAYFLEAIRQLIPNVKATTLSRPVSARLESYDWPGNIRELKNMIDRAAVLSDGAAQLKLDHFPEEFQQAKPVAAGVIASRKIETYSDEDLRRMLGQENGNRTKLAKKLGCDRKTLAALLKVKGLGDGRRGRPKTTPS